MFWIGINEAALSFVKRNVHKFKPINYCIPTTFYL